MSVQPFEVKLPQATLDDLQQRLARTRLLPNDAEASWDAGMSPAYLAQLLRYWRSEYDWRAQEARLNRFAQFRATTRDGTTLHFIHERGRGDAPLPIVLTHGYPDSFLRFEKLIPLLTDPVAHGADARDAFDVVVPSLPGYAFSEKSHKAAGIFAVGDLWHELMTEQLGYQLFGAHGGDWGSTVTEHLARSHSAAVV
ncbi:MAG TPA: epoxide hydrolase, partial [Polyangiaceae bacterium]